MATEIKGISVALGATLSEFDQKLSAAQGKLKNFGGKLQGIGQSLSTGISLPLAGVGAAALLMAGDFNRSMGDIATLIPNSTERVQELKGVIQELSPALGKSTGDLSAGMFQVISAFGDGKDAASQLEIAVRAAAAGGSTTAEAINLLSAVTKGYGDTSAGSLQQVADLAFETNKLGQTTFPELASSMGRVVPLAASLNVSQEELFGTMATATGVTGNAAEVSTQLRGVLQSLLAPTDNMNALFAAMGVESGKAALEQFGLQGVINQVVGAAEASGEPLQSYVGSIEGQTLALALAGPQADTFTEKLAAMQNAAGAADQAFKDQTTGVNAAGFAFDRFKAKVQVVTQQFGDVLIPVFNQALSAAEPILAWIEGAITGFQGLNPNVQQAVVIFGALLAGIGPLVLAGGTLLTFLGGISAPVLLAVGAVAAVTAGFLAWRDEISQFVTGISLFFGEIVKGDPILSGLLSLAQSIGGFFKNEFLRQVDALRNAFGFLFDKVSAVFEFFRSKGEKALKDQAAAQLEAAQGTEEHRKKVEAIQEAANKWAAEQRAVKKETDKATDATVDFTKEIKGAKKELERYEDILIDVENAYIASTGEAKAATEGAERFAESVQNSTLIEEAGKIADSIGNIGTASVAMKDEVSPLFETVLPASIKKYGDEIAATQQAFADFGIKSREELESLATKAEEQFNLIAGSGEASAQDIDAAWVMMTEARKAALVAQGIDLPAEEQKTLDRLKAKLEGFKQDTTGEGGIWSEWAKEIQGKVSTLADDISAALFSNDPGSFLKKGKDGLKDLGLAFRDQFTSKAQAALSDLIELGLNKVLGLLDDIVGKLPGVGSAFSKAFGGGGSGAAGSAAGSAGGAGAGIGGAAATTGIQGTLNTIFGGISAATGIFGLFQNARQETTLNAIEENTRKTSRQLIEPGGIQDRLNEFLPWLKDIGTAEGPLWTIRSDTFNLLAIKDRVTSMADTLDGWRADIAALSEIRDIERRDETFFRELVDAILAMEFRMDGRVVGEVVGDRLAEIGANA